MLRMAFLHLHGLLDLVLQVLVQVQLVRVAEGQEVLHLADVLGQHLDQDGDARDAGIPRGW